MECASHVSRCTVFHFTGTVRVGVHFIDHFLHPYVISFFFFSSTTSLFLLFVGYAYTCVDRDVFED